MEDFLDLRIQKTRRLLINALFDSLANQAICLKNKIKVCELCKKANVSSITFYKHFKNSNELIKYAINDQINDRMPIPLKFKPKTLKEFIFYLVDFLLTYLQNNKLVFFNSIIYVLNHGFKNSYLDLLIQIIIYYVKKEMKLLFINYDIISINVWTELIIGGLFYLLIKRTYLNEFLDSNFLIIKIKELIQLTV